MFVCVSVCLCYSFLSIHETGIQNKLIWLTQGVLFMPFEKGRQCCPCPEQDISFESKKNWFCPSTKNRNYLKMYPLLWQPRENLFLYLPFDLSCSSSYLLPQFHTLNLWPDVSHLDKLLVIGHIFMRLDTVQFNRCSKLFTPAAR